MWLSTIGLLPRKGENMITEYICEKCRSKFKTKDEALKCEANHLKAEDLKVEEVVFIYKSDVFPALVMLSTNDGRKQVYQRYYGGQNDA